MKSTEAENAMPLSVAKRKERLLREAAMYRAAIQKARVVVGHNLHVDVLARSVVTQAKVRIFSTLGGLVRLKGRNVQTLLPIALSAISFAARAKLLVPLLRVAVVLGAVGAGAGFIVRRKRRQQMDRAV